MNDRSNGDDLYRYEVDEQPKGQKISNFSLGVLNLIKELKGLIVFALVAFFIYSGIQQASYFM